MRYSVRYADGTVEFETDMDCTIAECRGCGTADEGAIMKQALAGPMASPGFGEFASSSKKLLFILCDGTRPTPTSLVLEHLYPEIAHHPDVSFIIATGTHRPPTEAEFKIMFGEYLDEFRSRIFVHDSRNADANMFVGTTSRGTPVSFSKRVMGADGLVTVNSVEPHYFAGYTGGRKSFLPGVAGFETIERNHSHATEPGALPLVLDGNPISEDMFEALDFISGKRIFSIQTVMAPDNTLVAAFAGDIRKTFISATEKANDIYSIGISRRASIVVTVAPPPMDRDLYQSQKALENARNAIEPGGAIILVSSCWDGIGDRGFYDQLLNATEDTKASDLMGENYRLGNHKAARLLSLAEQAEIWAVTGLDEAVLAPARIRGFKSLQEAVDLAIGKMQQAGRQPNILVLPGGSMTVPRVVG
ncbi:MAG: nickel-dependent lactate racemase [Thermoplasmata archaeon]